MRKRISLNGQRKKTCSSPLWSILWPIPACPTYYFYVIRLHLEQSILPSIFTLIFKWHILSLYYAKKHLSSFNKKIFYPFKSCFSSFVFNGVLQWVILFRFLVADWFFNHLAILFITDTFCFFYFLAVCKAGVDAYFYCYRSLVVRSYQEHLPVSLVNRFRNGKKGDRPAHNGLECGTV